jgi:hypothetical protein
VPRQNNEGVADIGASCFNAVSQLAVEHHHAFSVVSAFNVEPKSRRNNSLTIGSNPAAQLTGTSPFNYRAVD